MKLNYFTLLSFKPIYIQNVGSIKSPTLNEISDIGLDVYNSYLSILSLDIKSYYSIIDKMSNIYFAKYSEEDKQRILSVKNEYESFDESKKSEYSFFDIMIFDNDIKKSVLNALNFFFNDDVIYNESNHVFLTYDGSIDKNNQKRITGIISSNIYPEVIDCILKRNYVSQKEDKPKLKFKSKLAQEIWELTHKEKDNKQDKDMDLGNLISSVAAKNQSLNIINIWDMTIYQLYDQFKRTQGNVFFDINATSVAAYGDENEKFDGGAWYKNNYSA